MDFVHHRRAQACIAQGALTNSKKPESHILGVYPTHFVSGRGCQLLSTDGRWFVDFICGLGTNLLGYGHEMIARAIQKHLRDGYSHSFPTIHELECAEALKECIPFVDTWKFLKSGSEACSAAIRIARAATGRTLVLSEGYHGWHDGFVSLTPPATGIPPAADLQFGRLSEIEITSQVAAVIVEPVITDWSPARMAWLLALREQCTKVGALLIFDEVISGFRWRKFAVSVECGVIPDLIVMGKALASGMPLAAVGGKRAVMDGAYFVSSSFAGEILSLVAAKESIRLLQRTGQLEEIWDGGGRFLAAANDRLSDCGLRIDGYPTRGVFVGDPFKRALLFQECCLAGILFGPSWFWNLRHVEHETHVLGALQDIAGRIHRGEVKLHGAMPESPFAAKVRGQA